MTACVGSFFFWSHPTSFLRTLRHVAVCLRGDDFLRSVPNEDGTLSTTGDNVLLIWGNGNLAHDTGVTHTLVVGDTFIVVPQADNLVLARGNELLTLIEDGKGVKLTILGTIEHTNGLAVEAVPVGNLAVGTTSQKLRFIGMVNNLFEHSRFEKTKNSSVILDVPNDAGTIITGRDSLTIIGADSNVRNTATVLLEGSLHNLGLSTDLPDADLTFHTTRDDALTVRGRRESSDTVVMGIVDSVEELSGLRKEGTDLTIVPTREDRLAISHEVDAMAFESWNLNSKEFLTSFSVPNSNIVQGASSEKFGVTCRESNIVNALVVASVSEFRLNFISVAPVDSGHGGTAEEVCVISGERD
mmetsp:Transcript_64175/g.88776  ORF Transcript_64175/g.88776 Transcript_64175/m.88776 type:complete len:357 (-) Transcript_64175:969-2039(-)